MSELIIEKIPPRQLIDDISGHHKTSAKLKLNKHIVTRESLGVTDTELSNADVLSSSGLEDTLISNVCPVTGENVSLDVLTEVFSKNVVQSIIDACTVIEELMPVVCVEKDKAHSYDHVIHSDAQYVFFPQFVGKSLSPKNDKAMDKYISRSMYINNTDSVSEHILLVLPDKQFTGNRVLSEKFINIIDLTVGKYKAATLSISSPPTNFLRYFKDSSVYKSGNIDVSESETGLLTFRAKVYI